MTVVITSYVKDVDKRLPRKPMHRRPAGEIISPLTYTNDLVNFDHWDHLFMTNCCKSLTLHNFDGPPSTILDIGCGRGLWAIEAGKMWQGSTIVGFDVQSVQPKLSILDKNLARRLKWVHGNLLDGLPFLDGQFGFVRMVRMGLHIPEDEWGYVLAEISRVLSPNGVFEVIEEDLIFPSQVSFCSAVSSRSSDNSSPRSSNTAVSVLTPFSKSDPSITGSGSKSDLLSGSSSSLPLKMRGADPKCAPDPRDHSRLRRAWEEMLSDSFLAPNLLSILPFHLDSWFREIQTHPPLEVPLPPNSSCKRNPRPTTGLRGLVDPDALFQLRTLFSSESEDESSGLPDRNSPRRGVSSWASMHLARTVRTISACKESIWRTYEKLYGHDPSIPSLVRSAQAKYLKKHFDQAQSTANPLRDYFERDWINWENDMADRASVRGSIQSELSWSEPFGKPPEWRVCFNSLPPPDEIEYDGEPELCRRLRGFVCFKEDTTSLDDLIMPTNDLWDNNSNETSKY